MWISFSLIAYSQLKMCFIAKPNHIYDQFENPVTYTCTQVCMYVCTLVHRYVLLILEEWNRYVLNDKFYNSRSNNSIMYLSHYK